MYYPEEIVEEVRQRNDIVDVISSYVKLQKKGSNHMGLCPFHGEKTPSFSVSRSKQMYHCFGCGVGGNVFTFVMEYENYTFIEALKMLADRAGVNLPEAEYSEEDGWVFYDGFRRKSSRKGTGISRPPERFAELRLPEAAETPLDIMDSMKDMEELLFGQYGAFSQVIRICRII